MKRYDKTCAKFDGILNLSILLRTSKKFNLRVMDKKYKLTDETILHKSKTLYRIEALRDFNDVKKGDKGGFIECEDNLSQEGNCWIYDNAKVFNNAIVRDNACVYDIAEVYGNAKVAMNAMVYDMANISDDARIESYAKVYGEADINGHAFIGGSTRVYEEAIVRGIVVIKGSSKIHGDVNITGDVYIIDAEISKKEDYIVFKNWWSSGRYFTWTRSNNMWQVGCFYGTGEELIAKAYKDSELSGREYERIVRYVEAINQPAKRLNRIQKIVCKLFNIK